MKVNFRNSLGWAGACFLLLFGFVNRAKKRVMNGDYIMSIYFHKPSRAEFETCIKWLKKNKFTFLSTLDIERIIQKELSFPKGAVVITVDDGWESNEVNIIDVVNKYKVPVTIFISTAPVEEGTYWWSYLLEAQKKHLKVPTVKALKKYTESDRLLYVNKVKDVIFLKREAMTIEQVKTASNSEYVTIGGHTHTHPILVNCSEEQVYKELQLSKEKLESWTGKRVTCFAYPNGDYSAREIQYLKRLDYNIAFCSDPKPFTNVEIKSNYTLPRFGYLEGASMAENICRLVGVWQPLMLKMKFLFQKNQHEKGKRLVPENSSVKT